MNNCSIEYEAAWSMPIEIRKWWIGRKNKEEAKKSEKKPGGDNPGPIPFKGPPPK